MTHSTLFSTAYALSQVKMATTTTTTTTTTTNATTTDTPMTMTTTMTTTNATITTYQTRTGDEGILEVGEKQNPQEERLRVKTCHGRENALSSLSELFCSKFPHFRKSCLFFCHLSRFFFFFGFLVFQ